MYFIIGFNVFCNLLNNGLHVWCVGFTNITIVVFVVRIVDLCFVILVCKLQL